MIHLQARVEIGAFNVDEKIAWRYSDGDFSSLLNAVKYAEKFEQNFNPFTVLERAFSEYRPPSNVEELLLKAEIEGNVEWVDFWRKYAPA